VPLGKADVKRTGSDLTIATFSYCLLETLAVADELAETYGIDIEVVDLRSVVPLDMETILASVAKTGRLLAVHESRSWPVSMRKPLIYYRLLPVAWAWPRSPSRFLNH